MEHTISCRELADKQYGPAFTVCNNKVAAVNKAAERFHISEGTELKELMAGNMQAYQNNDGSKLYLTMENCGKTFGVTIVKKEGCDLFLIEDPAPARLQTLALAAKELRGSFSQVYFVTERMCREETSFSVQTHAAYKQSTMRLQRLIANMADAAEYKRGRMLNSSVVNLTALFEEVFEKTAAYLGDSKLKLYYHGLQKPVTGVADPNMLRRAAYNLLSNAIKFSPRDGTVEAWLTQNGSQLQLTIQDSGEGVPEYMQGALFTRYQRPPSIEDGRLGMGLGLLLVRSIASMHGGTVLLQQSRDKGAKIGFTISIQPPVAGKLYTQLVTVDRTGGADQALLELSDVLPISAYENE